MVTYIDVRLMQVIMTPALLSGMVDPTEPISPLVSKLLILMEQLGHAVAYTSDRHNKYWEPTQEFFRVMRSPATRNYPSAKGEPGTVFVQEKILQLAKDLPVNTSMNNRIAHILPLLEERDLVSRDVRGSSAWWYFSQPVAPDSSLLSDLRLTREDLFKEIEKRKDARPHVSRVLVFDWRPFDEEGTMRGLIAPVPFSMEGEFLSRWMLSVGLIELSNTQKSTH